MDDQNKNLILASVLSFVVIIAWFILFPPPEPIQTEEQNIEQAQVQGLPAQDIQETVTLPSDLSDNKDVPINFELSGFTSNTISIDDTAGALTVTPTANITAGSTTPPLPGVAPDEEKEKIVVQEKINKDVFDDVSRIVSFISVDGASNAALIQNEFITSFPQVDALSIQRL